MRVVCLFVLRAILRKNFLIMVRLGVILVGLWGAEPASILIVRSSGDVVCKLEDLNDGNQPNVKNDRIGTTDTSARVSTFTISQFWGNNDSSPSPNLHSLDTFGETLD